jgi:hypothetical protein
MRTELRRRKPIYFYKSRSHSALMIVAQHWFEGNNITINSNAEND